MRADRPLATLPGVTIRQTLDWPVAVPPAGNGTATLLSTALAATGLRPTPAC
jgi:hypothetical protein